MFCVVAVPPSPKDHCQLLIAAILVKPNPLKLKLVQEDAVELNTTESILGLNKTVSTGIFRLKRFLPGWPGVAP